MQRRHYHNRFANARRRRKALYGRAAPRSDRVPETPPVDEQRPDGAESYTALLQRLKRISRDGTRDALGLRVPPYLTQVWGSTNNQLKSVLSWQARGQEICKRTAPCLDKIDKDILAEEINKLAHVILATLPYALCQMCLNGHVRGNTQCICRGYGWLTKGEYLIAKDMDAWPQS